MPKSKGTRKARTRHQKHEVGAKIARMWARAQTHEAAAEAFDDEILRRLDCDKLDWDDVNRILASLPAEDLSPFMEEVEDLAANITLSAATTDGDLAVADIKLFTVPVIGSTAAMEADLPGVTAAMARALRASGFSPEKSNVAIFPVPLPVASLAAISPSDLFSVARRAGRILMSNQADTDMQELHDEIVANLTDFAFDAGSAGSHKEVTFGARFLLGAQMTVTTPDEDYKPTPDGLLFSDPAPDDEQRRDTYDTAIEVWDMLLDRDAEESDFRIDYPRCWAETRAHMLTLHVEQNIGIAKSMHGQAAMNPETPTAIDLRHDTDGLIIDAFIGQDRLTSIEIPRELLAYGVERFLDDLFERHEVRQVADDDQSTNSVHALPH